MKNPPGNTVANSVAMLLALMLALLVPHGSIYAQDRPAFSQAQLEQTLAPIALYPDPLLSQILMASTYPLEVVEAARWSRSHANLGGEDAVRAAENEDWDPSVKSLLAFPHLLARMDENLPWLQDLGDAFLDQEPQVMDAVQNLRRRAQVAGNLRSDERQQILETGPLLVVQPAHPQIIYVPYYDPRVVYGPWWWPHYSPVYWRPFPGYGAWPGVASGFYWGPSIRISIGYFFGGFDWSHRHVRVVHSNYYYRGAGNHRATQYRDRPPGAWHHDPGHRRGVAYRAPEVQRRFADHGTRPDSGRHLEREDARRQNQQRAQSYPSSNRLGDVDRPAVQVAAQPNRSSRVPAADRQDAQPYPSSRRHSESRDGARRAAIQPVRDTPVQLAIQPATVTQAHSGANPRAERRDQVKDRERRDRSVPVERHQATPAATPAPVAVPQEQRSRGNATSSRRDQVEPSAKPRAGVSSREPRSPSRSDQAERSARPRAGESSREPRSSPGTRQEIQRRSERDKAVQSTPDARPGSGWQRRASADNFATAVAPTAIAGSGACCRQLLY